jgi:protein O-mannosyl-transferase
MRAEYFAWKRTLLPQTSTVLGSTGKGRTWLLCSLLALLTLALYWPAGQFDFVDLDDPGYVFQNQVVRQGLSAQGLMWSLVDAHESNWHPVTWVSHMLDCQCFGLRPGAHHLVSVGLHCANTVLLFLVLRAMTGAFWRCAFAAALFAWHPLRVESVAWISERKDVLSGLFFLLTLYAYVKYAEERSHGVLEFRSDGEQKSEGRNPKSETRNGRPAPPTLRFYALALVFFALGLMSKPMLVTTPFVLLLLDYWPLRRLDVHHSNTPSLHHSITPSLHLLREKLPFLALSILGSLVTFCAQRSGGAVVSMRSEGFQTRVEHALLGGLGYLEKFFWPQHLAIFYLPPHNVKPALPALAVFLLVTFGVLMTLRRRPYLAVGWFWFVGMLVPVCGLVQVGPQYMADRYTYLPGIGLAVVLAWGAAEVFALIRNPQARRFLAAALAALLLAGCWVASRRQLRYWRNTETLMDHALEVDPQNYMAHNLLGAYFTRLGQPEAAALHHQRARDLWPH